MECMFIKLLTKRGIMNMWIGAAIFLSFMWGGGFGSMIQAYDESQIKVVSKVGGKNVKNS